jgi:hypothetical protein
MASAVGKLPDVGGRVVPLSVDGRSRAVRKSRALLSCARLEAPSDGRSTSH